MLLQSALCNNIIFIVGLYGAEDKTGRILTFLGANGTGHPQDTAVTFNCKVVIVCTYFSQSAASFTQVHYTI